MNKIAWVFAIALLVSMVGCRGASNDPLTVGIDNTAVNSLILIAADQNYFADNHLMVTLREYPSGLAAVNAIATNDVNLATASELVLVNKALAGEPVRALASIDKFMHNYLIGRTDHGIAAVDDLRGKTIGLPMGTAAEFYLGRFLELHEMSISEVTLESISPTDLVDALVSGRVDAVVTWQPNTRLLIDRLGDRVTIWPVQNEQATYATLISGADWAKQHPDQIKRFMRALVQAEQFYQQRPEDVKSILQKRLKYDQAYIDAIWPEHQFQLVLDQSMILAMEDEARWLIDRHLTPATIPPAFDNYLSMDAIQAVKPDGVNIIR